MGVFTTSKAYRLGLNLMTPWWLSGASIDLDFDNQRYYDSSLGVGVQSLAPLNNYLSISRASTGYAKTSAGALTNFGNNTLRITDLGLLIEDARTNLCLDSAAIGTTGNWNAASGNSVATGNSAVAPDGSTTATQIKENSSNTAHTCFQVFGSSTITANALVTYSIYVKNGTRPYVAINGGDNSIGNRASAVYDLTTGVRTTTSTSGTVANFTSPTQAEQLANGWWRIWITFSHGATNTSISLCLSNSATPTMDSSSQPLYVGDGASYAYFWGAQIEQASFPSSYIPTAGASATRAADLVQVAAGALRTLLQALPMSVILDVTTFSVGTHKLIGNDVGNWVALQEAGNDTQASSNVAGSTLFKNGINSYLAGSKVGVAMASGARSLTGSGLTPATDANAAASGSTVIALGAEGNTNFAFCLIRRATFWNSKISDANLQSFTT